MSSPPPSPPFWRRWIVEPVLAQLTQGVAPEQIALAFAIGGALALFPILGTTTALCLAAGVAFGLNQVILQLANLLCAFIWIPALVAFVRLGDAIARRPAPIEGVPAMLALFRHHPALFFDRFGLAAVHAIVGWAACAPVLAVGVYFILRVPLRAAARRIESRSRSRA